MLCTFFVLFMESAATHYWTDEVKSKICAILNMEMEVKNIDAVAVGVVDGKSVIY
jgi:hypothetical protein